jgi:hypothetical protein
MARRRQRKDRRREERGVEAFTFGAVIVLFTFSFLYRSLTPGYLSLIGGLILTGSAFYQQQRHWRVNPMTWIGGVALLLVGFMETAQNYPVPGGMLTPILVMAGVIGGSFLTGEL